MVLERLSRSEKTRKEQAEKKRLRKEKGLTILKQVTGYTLIKTALFTLKWLYENLTD